MFSTISSCSCLQSSPILQCLQEFMLLCVFSILFHVHTIYVPFPFPGTLLPMHFDSILTPFPFFLPHKSVFFKFAIVWKLSHFILLTMPKGNLLCPIKSFRFPTYTQWRLLAFLPCTVSESCLREDKDCSSLSRTVSWYITLSWEKLLKQHSSGRVTKQADNSFPQLHGKCFDGNWLSSPGRVSKCKSRLPLEFGVGCPG